MSIWGLQNWFKSHVTMDGKPFEVSDEQAKVILDDHKNTIITARAGSGKTRVIVAKIIYLIAHEGYDPDEIIAFAFNRNAKDELNERLLKVRVDGEAILAGDLANKSQIATTFHSFAARARAFGGEILSDNECDDKEKQAYIPNRSYFIQRIIKEKLNKKKVLEFIRESGDDNNLTEEYPAENADVLMTREESYYETLNGEIVKSFGEKIIADYLFEHDINYRYEKYDLYPAELVKFAKNEADGEKLKARNTVRPDFYLEDDNLIWEHWGVSGDETADEIRAINEAKVFDGGYEAYLAGKKWKEWFYRREWLNRALGQEVIDNNYYLSMALKYEDLITTYKEPFATREDFEEVIEAKLAEYGINKPKLSEEEIADKLINNKNREVVTRLTEQIVSFIDKAEHGFMLNYDRLRELCEYEQDAHISLFYELALETLEYYTNELTSDPSDEKQRPLLDDSFAKHYTTDFNILLDTASLAINEKTENPRLKVDGYRFIFIDEYQDFSELFCNLIKSLRERSQDAKMMVVGDDWQAINGYAGSDLKYFENFDEYFPDDSCRLELLTNYRSTGEIVNLSNEFMTKAGIVGSGSNVTDGVSAEGDSLNICNISEIRKKKDPNSKNKRTHRQQKYDLTLMEIIRENKNKSICILSRKKNSMMYGPLKNCKNIITSLFKNDDFMYATDVADEIMDKVSISTVNSAKGCEADVVVILETDNGSFPVIHPDTKLYRVFGEDEAKMIDEQKRLFYVALTRPKEKLYILHEKEFADDVVADDNFLTMLAKDELEEYEPHPKTLRDKIIDREVKCFVAKGVESRPNRNRPENQDYIMTAANGEQVYQFNANRVRDRESCELVNYLCKFFEENPNKGMRVWADVQEGRWIHFRRYRASDLQPMW